MPSGRLQDYEVLGMIGSGSYGICKKIRRRKDNKMLVWKELDYGKMSETEKQMLVSEVNLLRELKHPHIVRYYDRIIDRTNTTIYIVMEFCEGGDMGALIKKHKREKRYVTEDFVWKLLYQLVMAVQECHRRKDGGHVLHRDLKPANVFLDSAMNVKLGDFGLARVLSHDTSFARTFVGTPYYMSPEQVNKMSYNEKSDIWSLGCLVYELCALSPPFTALDQIRLEAKIKNGRFHPIPSHYSSSLSQVISSMLQVNDDMRPSIDELLRNPQLSRMQRENATTAQNNSGDKEESLRRWEQSLSEKEKAIERREKVLAERERLVAEREENAPESRHHYNGLNGDMLKRAHPAGYYHNLGIEKENDGDLISNGYIKRRYGYEKEPNKLEHHDDVVFSRPLFPAPRLAELGYRHPNVAGGNVRVARLLSGLR